MWAWHLFQIWAETADPLNILGVVCLFLFGGWCLVRSGRDEPVPHRPAWLQPPTEVSRVSRIEDRRSISRRVRADVEKRLHPSIQAYGDWTCNKCGHRWKGRYDVPHSCVEEIRVTATEHYGTVRLSIPLEPKEIA